jgi:uncharacterized protein (DUF302 family)
MINPHISYNHDIADVLNVHLDVWPTKSMCGIIMTYYFKEIVDMPFDEALKRVKEELMKEGFGIQMEIDVRETFQKKLGIEFRRYTILGACNPPIAHKAIVTEENIGLLLPCNVTVQEFENGDVQVAVIDPEASMMAVENSDIELIAGEVRDKLMHIIRVMRSD